MRPVDLGDPGRIIVYCVVFDSVTYENRCIYLNNFE